MNIRKSFKGLFQLFAMSGLMVTGLTAMAATHEVTLRSNGTSADVAVSVIDNKLATAEKENTILTSLLLNSDLRGSVEEAGWYFPDSLTHKHRQGMDGLMLTQGWSRYDIPAAIDGKYTEVESELEIGPSIGGVVKSRWNGKPMKDVIVLALAPSIGYAGQTITDEKGEFVFTDKDFPEGTRYIFQALNQNGDNEGNFDITKETYPSVNTLESAYTTADKDDNSDEASITDYNWRIAHSDGMMNVMLGEVMVVQKKLSDYENPMELMARGDIDYKKFEEQNLRTVEDIIRTIPGIVVKDHNAYYQNRMVDFWVDNIPWPSSTDGGFPERLSTGGIIARIQMNSSGGGPQPQSNGNYNGEMRPTPQSGGGSGLNSSNMFGGFKKAAIDDPTPGIIETALGEIDQVLPVDFIKRVQFFPPNVSTLFSPSATTSPMSTGGIVMITTKDGTEKVSRPDWRMRYATPLGYQRSKTFYTPKYELMADYELNNRPTLYWIPSAKVDRFGNLSMPIPASVESCTLIAEGIDANGHPVRLTKSM